MDANAAINDDPILSIKSQALEGFTDGVTQVSQAAIIEDSMPLRPVKLEQETEEKRGRRGIKRSGGHRGDRQL